ncbi:MAG: helix-turn-helix transcriptional regulator [Vogesella sp.]|uniref:helix-turn-helix transcriptional regulator n=1 Tax=Vogesella sp. TaxID=1904252 RepID=UPI003F41793B
MARLQLEQLSPLIAELYASIATPAALPLVLRQLERLLDVDLVHLMINSNDQRHTLFNVYTNDAFLPAAESYEQHYSGIDPRKALLRQKPVGEAYCCAEYFDDAFVSRSALYQEWLIPHGGRYVGGGCVMRNQQQNAHLAFHHFLGRKPFGQDKMAVIRLLLPHVVQMLQLREQTQALRERAAIGLHALEHLQYGVAGLGEEGELRYANRQAEALLPQLADDVRPSGLQRDGQLYRLLQQCRLLGHAVSYRQPQASGALHCLLLPVSRSVMWLPETDWESCHTRYLLILNHTRQQRVAPASQLRELFGLSPAEARLAHALGCGQTVEHYAAANCVSVNTVRTQLRQVLEKTGESRQPDLIRMLMLIPPL